MNHLYRFCEDFICLGEDHLPYSIDTEVNSVFAHKHVREENGRFFISCTGNKYFFRIPQIKNCCIGITAGFRDSPAAAGFSLFFGYDRATREGYSLDFSLQSQQVYLTLRLLTPFSNTILDTLSLSSNEPLGDLEAFETAVCLKDGKLRGTSRGLPFSFPNLLTVNKSGAVGIAFQRSLGEMFVDRFTLESDDDIEERILLAPIFLTIPLRNGGNMPYILTYSIVQRGGLSYLDYTFDGGAQYRDRYLGYPRKTGQYTVEQDRIYNPFLTLYDNGDDTLRWKIYSDVLTTTDPGLHWYEVLSRLFNIVKLPLNGSLFLGDFDAKRISFGYRIRETTGYLMQTGENIEFIWDIGSGELLYEGTDTRLDTILLSSPPDKKAVSLLPADLPEREKAVAHFAGNHYFAQDEPICFTVSIRHTIHATHLILDAVICDVYGDDFSKPAVAVQGDSYEITDRTFDVGVYRLKLAVGCGKEIVLQREIVFEVYDSAGKRCAPLESGLPFLYSMPNEQRYLDCDAFDPFNPCPDCDMPHYYAASSFTGDVAIRKHIWDAIHPFGRRWYVWLSDHRTMTADEVRTYHDLILRNADDVYYPLRYEWAVMRHDYFSTIGYNHTGLLTYLREFLALHPECPLILDENAETLTNEQLQQLGENCFSEWVDYANECVRKDVVEDDIRLRKINPSFRRACYGPLPIYVIPMTTHYNTRFYGFDSEKGLENDFFDGFAQLEDYPFSCAYHTYRGAFFAMNLLLHTPGLALYPEEYTSSYGGCIDGAVKDAAPPFGKYDMPTYFNVTHSYEYVFNTAHLTANGFSYWEKRGFMQRDFAPEFVEEFIRGWKNVVYHTPSAPCRTTAYLSEIDKQDDRYSFESDNIRFFNISDIGLSYLYESSRYAGLPAGFVLDRKALDILDSALTDLLVLPSLENAAPETIEKIRMLYHTGVSLLAVSDVGPLIDLFGVRKCPREKKINHLCDLEGRCETILPETCEFFYEAEDAEVILQAGWQGDDETFPAIMRRDRAAVINAPLTCLGHDSFRSAAPFVKNISPLVRETVCALLRSLSEPRMLAMGCSLTLLDDTDGNTLLLAIDYSPYVHSPYDKSSFDTRLTESEIDLCASNYSGFELLYGPTPLPLISENRLEMLRLSMHYQQCILLRLLK